MTDINVSDLEESQTVEPLEVENQETESNTKTDIVNAKEKTKNKLIRLPVARVKHIMKLDPDCSIINSDTVVLVSKATELFIELMAREAFKNTNLSKRKTINKHDLNTVIETASSLCFLEGMLD